MSSFRYFIVKYIADPKRCEPVNFGIILLSDFQQKCRFLQRQDRGMPREVFERWKTFFEEEIKNGVRNFDYVNDHCMNVGVTKPLVAITDQDFDELFEELYYTMVYTI